jgi:hypothetical protein
MYQAPLPEDFRVTVIIRCARGAWYIESASAEEQVSDSVT